MHNARRLTETAREKALLCGADLVGIVKVHDLPEHRENIVRILPGARSVMVVAATHSLSAIRSANNETAQFDTIHAYGQCERAAHAAVRFLESDGFGAVAIPAFIPLDMGEATKGMRGEICWRRAAVRAGLGSYGENGLLVTRQYGSAVRLAGLVTEADLEADAPLQEDVCDHCMRCVAACPVGALSGGGKINKKVCGEKIFKYGFRFFQRFMEDLVRKPVSDSMEVIRGYGLREMWQTFMTGNYYYCFHCQAQCPASRLPKGSGGG